MFENFTVAKIEIGEQNGAQYFKISEGKIEANKTVAVDCLLH